MTRFHIMLEYCDIPQAFELEAEVTLIVRYARVVSKVGGDGRQTLICSPLTPEEQGALEDGVHEVLASRQKDGS